MFNVNLGDASAYAGSGKEIGEREVAVNMAKDLISIVYDIL